MKRCPVANGKCNITHSVLGMGGKEGWAKSAYRKTTFIVGLGLIIIPAIVIFYER